MKEVKRVVTVGSILFFIVQVVGTSASFMWKGKNQRLKKDKICDKGCQKEWNIEPK